MGKKLAIKGHLSRGKEVIELFKMMGGCECGYCGGGTDFYYYISQFGNIEASCKPTEFDTYIVYTLEEFLEKYPYKVGDKVHIYIQNDDIDGRYDIEVAEITSMRWNPARCKIAYKMKDINREFYKEEIKCKVDDSNKSNKVMGKKLAIKGHATRGKEVIELLEMLGGINDREYIGTNTWKDEYYFLDNGYIRAYDWCDGIKFTLEEFLMKYPFKVGDKVVYTKFGDNCDDFPVTIESMKWTGTTIEYTFNDCVTCLAKDLKMWNGEPDTVISGIYLNSCDYADEVELYLGDYEIEVRDGKTYAVKKKPVYPKTYGECCDVLGYDPCEDEINCYKSGLIESFVRLLTCYDAYRKIVGEQMGLGKPWEPNWVDAREVKKYSIIPVYGSIDYTSIVRQENRILVFPTDEIRTEFYYNFKDLIEKCKELL